ncbi:MAG TPA: TonB-dependent receptor [Panacibacter sp.]|nr:TonB-dependent receptor [Panacibacter sp.]HNP46595.1 TonB-dependent receptor [Panacibacter sp.]
MKKGLLVFVILFVALNLSAQDKEANAKVTGKVMDSLTNTPLEYATISLFKPGDKKAINGSTSNKDGIFTVTGVLPGNYSVVIEFIGYHTFSIKNVQVPQKRAVIELPAVMLVKKTGALQNVTVTSSAKLIDNKIDKLVFNAEKDITAQTGVATDVLKKVPQVSVDVDGNVELAGSSSIRFLINGKPSTAFGNSIADVLQSIPANQIRSIEVITNPGAKYDAQGLGGIINIVLKKSTAEGINGNVSLTAGTIMENGSLNINARKGKFGMNAFFSGSARLETATPIANKRLSTDTVSKTLATLQQDGVNRFKRHGYQTGLGFDWSPNDQNSFSGSVSYNNFGFAVHGTLDQSQVITGLYPPSDVLSLLNSVNRNSSDFGEHNIDAGLNYKKKFSKDDQELEVNINSSFGNNHIAGQSSQYLQPADSLFFGTSSVNPGTETSAEMAVDYTQPFAKNIKLGVGGKLSLYDIKSSSGVLLYQPADGIYAYDSSLSNRLDYKQDLYAVYAELTFPVARIFDAKIGGRYERTAIDAYFSDAGAKAPTPGYNTFVPSLFLSRKLDDNQSIKLNYSQRIQRPDYNDLNPYINTTDPKNITAGNPYLKPETGGRIELSYNRNLGKAGSFMVSLFYRENHNDIQPFIVYYPTLTVGDSTYKNVSVTTRQNIGTEDNMGTNLFADVHMGGKLSMRMNVFLFYRHTINHIDTGYNSNSFNYRTNLNVSYQFNNKLAAEFFGNFNSPRHEAQGRYPSFATYSFAIRKQFWDKKGSVALSAINPFSKYVLQETNIFGPGFTAVNNRKVPFRSVSINFTWKFGKLTFKKEPENNNNNLPAES